MNYFWSKNSATLISVLDKIQSWIIFDFESVFVLKWFHFLNTWNILSVINILGEKLEDKMFHTSKSKTINSSPLHNFYVRLQVCYYEAPNGDVVSVHMHIYVCMNACMSVRPSVLNPKSAKLELRNLTERGLNLLTCQVRKRVVKYECIIEFFILCLQCIKRLVS